MSQVLTRDTASANGGGAGGPGSPYELVRRVRYNYQEPAYDSWLRKLVGFRKVSAQLGDEAAITETTFWFGPCEAGGTPSADDAGVPSKNHCPFGSDDELGGDSAAPSWLSEPTYRLWVGKPVRTDRYVPANPGQGVQFQLLWTQYFEYATPVSLLAPPGERRVTFTYAKRTGTRLYRPDQGVAPGSRVVPLTGGDAIELPGGQAAAKVVERSAVVDTNGTVVEQRDVGDAAQGDLPRVTQSSDAAFGGAPAVTCDSTWRCLPTYVTTAEVNAGGLVPRRRTRLTYDPASRDLTLVEAYLEADHFLTRAHNSGAPFSSGPPSVVFTVCRVAAVKPPVGTINAALVTPST